MTGRSFLFQTTQMSRKSTLFLFQVAAALFLLAISHTIPTAAQSPARQQRKTSQPLIADDEVGRTSLGAIFRIFPAWGTNDFRTHHVTGDLRLAADWDFAPQLKLSLNPNAGVGVYEDERGKVFAAGLVAVTLNYLPTKKLNPFIDVGLLAPEEHGGKSAFIADGGVAYIVRPNIQLDASVGTGAHGHTPPHPFISLGVSIRTNALRRRR